MKSLINLELNYYNYWCSQVYGLTRENCKNGTLGMELTEKAMRKSVRTVGLLNSKKRLPALKQNMGAGVNPRSNIVVIILSNAHLFELCV